MHRLHRSACSFSTPYLMIGHGREIIAAAFHKRMHVVANVIMSCHLLQRLLQDFLRFLQGSASWR